MAFLIKVEGVPPLDGDYELDPSSFKNRELRDIKRMSGVRVLEMQSSLEAGDNDLQVAFAAIALQRAGKTFDERVLWEAEVGAFKFVDTEADASPPDEKPLSAPADSTSSSGASSSATGAEHPATSIQNGSGMPESATTAISGLATSQT